MNRLLCEQVSAALAFLRHFLWLLARKSPLWQRRRSGSMMFRVIFLSAVLATGFVNVGCKTNYIPNTEVVDTEFNRKVISFCEDYRRAVERRDVGVLLSLAHQNYYEDGGNINSTDDIDYAGLREFLENKFVSTKAIRYEVRYKRVEGRKDGTITVDFVYSASYKIPTDDGDVWRRQVADDRLELIEAEDSFLILSGM